MAAVYSNLPSDLSLCEATTGWTGAASLLLDSVMTHQGTNCLSEFVDNTTGTLNKYAIGSAKDMSNGEHYEAWMMVTGIADTKANGGYRLHIEDSAGAWKLFYVEGSDTRAGGWQIITVDVSSTPFSSSGTIDLTDITIVGVQFKTITSAPSQGQNEFNNCFWDAVRYGTGLTVTSGATDNITLEDIYTYCNDSTRKYSVLQKLFGAYILTGTISAGTTGTDSVDLLVAGQGVLANDSGSIAEGFCGIVALGNTTGTTNVETTGSFIKSAGKAFAFDFSGANLDTILIDGNTLENFADISFQSGQTITNNVLSSGGLITPNAATFTSNTVKLSARTTSYALFLPKVHNMSDCSFTSNYWAFGVTPATSGDIYTLDGDQFTSNTADVRNTHATNAVTISATNGANPSTSSTAGGVVTISQDVTVAVTNVVIGSAVRVDTVDGNGDLSTNLINEIATTSTVSTSTNFAGLDFTAISIRVRYSSSTPKYLPYNASSAITATGISVAANQVEDTIAT